MKYFWFLLCLIYVFLNTSSIQAQSLTGKVLDDNSGNPVANVEIKINQKIVLTDPSGKFYYEADEPGALTINIEFEGYKPYSLDMALSGTDNVNLGTIFLSKKKLDVVRVDDSYLIDQRQLDNFEIDGQQVSSLLSASWDPFGSMADYNFSVTRFNPRGLAQNHSQIYLNNLPFNNLSDGRYFWSLWGGLNDVLRVRYSQFGLNSTDFSVGGMSGALDIDMRASSQRAQTRLTYSISNRTYTDRAMLTHSSGLSQSGWSYSFSVSKRWGNAGYIEGTYYDAYSYFASVDKKINEKHSLNLVAFAAPTIRGRGSSSTREMYQVLGDNFYNPNWGFQNGKIRNSREYRTHQPVAMIRHDWKLNDNSIITTTAGIQTGYFGSTRLDWLEASDPRPDYYRNLPYASSANPVASEAIAEELRNNVSARQINFDELIAINQQRQYLVRDPNGNSENNYIENISAYIIEEQRFNNQKIAVQSHINHQFKENIAFNAGIQLQYDKNHQYKILDDLLGGSYYLDIDNFALRDFPDDFTVIQNDISQPNRLLSEGDIFGYNHYIHNQNANIWSTLNLSLDKVDLTLSGSLQHTRFWREGNVANGKFPETSMGESEMSNFTHGQLKVGATYKINGRNYVYANAGYLTRAPFSRFAFLSPRIRNALVEGLTIEKTIGGELGYVLRHPRINARLTGFYYRTTDGINSVSFFHDEFRGFVNYNLTGIDNVNYGLEFGADFKVSQVLSLRVASAIGEYYWDSRPSVTITQDNSGEVLAEGQTVYLQGFNLPSMPQIAHTAEIRYTSPKFWSVSLNANYFDDIFVDPNPSRRTTNAIDGVSPTEDPERYNAILGQEKFDAGFTMDFFASKSWKFGRHYIRLSAGINNILDNTDFITGGFEQLRFDFEGKDPERFTPRYFYAFGRTYFIGISYSL